MKKLLLTLIVVVQITIIASAQTLRCSVKNANDESSNISVPDFAAQRTTNTIYTIPVLVHVVFQNASQDVPDSQVVKMIAIMNEDFGRYNADTVNTPSAFTSVAAPTAFQFCLAKRDTLGNPITGIRHIQTTCTSFPPCNLKSTASGGDDAWNTDMYYNIWLANLGNGLFATVEYPWGTIYHSIYGPSILYTIVKNIGTNILPYNKGRSVTHIVGHSFGLLHLTNGFTCADNDSVADTPLQQSDLFACPSFPSYDNCSPTFPGIMFMNFMEQTDDACLNMFTQGQATRMFNIMNYYFNSLLYADSLCNTPTEVQNIVEGKTQIQVSPNPFTTSFIISIQKQSLKQITFILKNIFGQIIFSKQENNLSNNYTQEINLRNLERGIYLLDVNIDGEQSVRKIVKD